MSLSLRLGIVAALVSGAVSLAAQAQRPTFKAGVDLVPVDVSVIDKDGRPVPDLTADDFVLSVDGRPRNVVSAQFFSVPSATQDAPSTTPAYYSTNAGAAGGRLIVMVVDAGNISTARSKTALDAASRFVSHLSKADRIALVTLPSGGAQIDFTSNHALIQAALPKIVGQSSAAVSSRSFGVGGALAFERSDEAVVQQIVERQCGGDSSPTNPLGREACVQQLVNEANIMLSDARARASQSISALQHLFDRLATNETPKTIVLISEGMLISREYSEITWIGPRAASAHITLHVLHIDTTDPNAGDRVASPTRNEDREVLRDGLEAMAGMARGDLLRIVSAPDLVFQRLALELSGYYLLGFEPQPGDRDARPHKIKIDVGRRNVEVHARREFNVAPPTTPTSDTLLLDALRSPLLIPDIGLKLTTYVFKDPDSPRLKLILAADIDRSANPEGRYSLAYVLVDTNGKAVANQLEKTLTTPTRPDTHIQTYVGAAFAPPGSYTLKLAVVDDTGRRGTVERNVSAKLNAFGAVQSTELLIADNSGPAVGGLTPTVDAGFTGDEVDGYLEMFADAADAFKGATATIEVAESESSKALVGSPASIDTRERRAVVQGNVPIGVLPAGDYILRASISLGGRETGTVCRPFRIARAALTSAASVKPAPAKTAAPMPSVSARSDGFDKTIVLTPQVVGFFLDRLSASAAPAASLQPALDNARAGKFDDITRALGNARDDQLAVPFLQGLVLLSRGELNPAANKFRDALRIDSEFLPAAFYLGACYAAGGKDREAVSAWQMSLVTETNAPFIYMFLGDALLRLRDFDQAISLLTEAHTLFPENEDINGRLTTALFTTLRTIHDAHAAGRSLGKPDADRARFARYADAYAAAKGPQVSVVEQWRKQMDRK